MVSVSDDAGLQCLALRTTHSPLPLDAFSGCAGQDGLPARCEGRSKSKYALRPSPGSLCRDSLVRKACSFCRRFGVPGCGGFVKAVALIMGRLLSQTPNIIARCLASIEASGYVGGGAR